MIRCKLFGHKFLGKFEEGKGLLTTVTTLRAVPYCVRCGAPRDTPPSNQPARSTGEHGKARP